MESRAKLFGHPIHQMLIVFPLGLLVSAVIFDILHLLTGNTVFSTIAYYNIAGGILGGLVAAVFGAIDGFSIPTGTRARSVAIAHGVGNVVVVLLFTGSWLLRRGVTDFVPSSLALVLSFAGVALGGITAWLGGELVNRLGVGVDPGANLDAPNSLTHPTTGSRRTQR